MLQLAALFEAAGEQVRARSRLGSEILRDPGVAESAELAPATYAVAEDDIRAATAGKHGLLSRSMELDADALVLRATVLTYRWIDELQDAALHTIGSIAARAIGYLAPEVALGGAVVSAGLIETDPADRAGVASYLSELAENNPELMDHVTSGGGGLLDGLPMRSMLTTGMLDGRTGRLAARGGLRAAGVAPFPVDAGSALRDIAAGLVESVPEAAAEGTDECGPPRSLEQVMTTLAASPPGVHLHRIGPDRFIAYLPGPGAGGGGLRLADGDHTAYDDQVRHAIAVAVAGSTSARVMLVGSGQGGVTAAQVAAAPPDGFAVDQVVTTGAPTAHVPRVREPTRMLCLADRHDPVALLGSLLAARTPNRLTVVFDGDGAHGHAAYVAGGRAADGAAHPEVRAELDRLQELGYLSGC
jgi:hypothetical protein